MPKSNADKALAAAESGAKKPAKRQSHGIYSYLNSGKLPSGRAYKRAQRQIDELRKQLIEMYGGEENIRPDIRILVEGAITSATIQLLCQTYLKKSGIFRQDSLKQGDLALHSVLQKGFSTYAALGMRQLETAAWAGLYEVPC